MINDIKQAIADKLAELIPDVDFYDEDVLENAPSKFFMLNQIEQDYKNRLTDKYKSTLSYDLAYISDKPLTEIKNDYYTMQELLLRGFDMIRSFRVLNKRANITDNVLHIIFDVKYSEMKVETVIPMQTQTIKTINKERR